MKLLSMARRNIFRNLRRTLLSGGAIAVAAFAMVTFSGFITGVTQDLASTLQNFTSGEVRIQHKNYEKNQNISPLHLNISDIQALLKKIDANPRVKSAAPRILFPSLVYREEEQKFLQGWALDFDRERGFADWEKSLVAGEMPKPGAKEALLGSALARDLGLKTGDSFTVIYRTSRLSSNATTFKVSGLFTVPLSVINRNSFLVRQEIMSSRLFMEDKATQVLVKTRHGDPEILAKELTALGESSWAVEVWNQIPSLYAIMGTMDKLYLFIALFFYLLGSTVIITTTMMVVFERIREIGTLSALGMTKNELLKLFFFEAFQISAGGSVVGVVLGMILVQILSAVGIDFRSVMDKMDFGMGGIIYPAAGWTTALAVFVSSVMISSLAALVPARRATKIPPVEALRTYS